MTTRSIHLDVCILGGGIAGLWTLCHLCRLGYRAGLVEPFAVGGGGEGQTTASQGIIHGGVKYALTGAASAASRAIAAMPGIWMRSLSGRAGGGVGGTEQDVQDAVLDLTGATTLASSQLLWTTPGIRSRFAAAAASKMIRTPVERLDPAEFPEPFAGRGSGVGGIDVYRVEEPVLDVSSVVARLVACAGAEHVYCFGRSMRDGAVDWLIAGAEGVDSLELPTSDRPSERARVNAERFVFAAGAGNEALIRAAFPTSALKPPRMQRRPLHMVMMRGEGLPAIYGHCLGMSDKPRMTITTSRDPAGKGGEGGEAVWYIGGQIAEQGVERGRDEQIAAAKREVAACMPWIDLAKYRPMWATWRVDRAEGLSPDGSRPDEPVVTATGNVITVWPTKLAFAPLVAQRVASMLAGAAVVAGGKESSMDTMAGIGEAGAMRVAVPPWACKEVEWTS